MEQPNLIKTYVIVTLVLYMFLVHLLINFVMVVLLLIASLVEAVVNY